MQATESPARDYAKELRLSARSKSRQNPRPYARRRRTAAKSSTRMQIPQDAGTALRQYWDEHALKTGIGMFWVWFAAANWQNLQQVSATLWSALGS